MRYGICGDPALGAAAADAGYDYFEWTVGGFLKPLESEDAFLKALDSVRSVSIPCPVVNCFLPGDHKVTGPAVDESRLAAYVQRTFERAGRAGVKTVVFGSGGARHIPEGFDRQRAHEQLVRFGRMAAEAAAAHGARIALEPLNCAECNVLNSVGEGAALVRDVNHPAFRLLVDGYHLMRDDDPVESIVANGALLIHAHVATRDHRLAPGGEPCDLAPFFTALAQAGYREGLSIEGKLPEGAATLPSALAAMRTLSVTA